MDNELVKYYVRYSFFLTLKFFSDSEQIKKIYATFFWFAATFFVTRSPNDLWETPAEPGPHTRLVFRLR